MVHRLQNRRGMKAARGKPARYRGAEPFIPKTSSLRRLEAAVDACRGCDLYRNATQGVFGEGPRAAPLMLVGEQPGDREDLEDAVVRGPGRRASGSRPRGCPDPARRRIPDERRQALPGSRARASAASTRRPTAGRSRPADRGSSRELEIVKPDVLVCLGATAAKSILRIELSRLDIARPGARIEARAEDARDDPSLGGLARSGFRRPPEALPAAGERSPCCRARCADLRAAARAAGGSSG